MVSTCGAGLAPMASARLAASWRSHGVPAPPTSPRHKAALLVGGAPPADEDLGYSARGRAGVLSERKAARFQQVFAELSSGACTIAVGQVPALFRTLNVPEPKANAERLLQDLAEASRCAPKQVQDPEALRVKMKALMESSLSNGQLQVALGKVGKPQPKQEPATPQVAVAGGGKAVDRLSYQDAMWLYEQVLLPDVAMAAVSDAVDEFVAETGGETMASCVNERLGKDPPKGKFANPASAKLRPLDGGVNMPEFKSSQQGRFHDLARDAKHAALYRLPPQQSPRNGSIFKKVGKFTVRPFDA